VLSPTPLDRAFLGRGWRFPVLPDAQGRLGWAEAETRIEQSIWLVLATRRGERVMRPDFGCGIHDLVFEPNAEIVHGLIEAEVQAALVRWEPRIDVLAVDAIAAEGQPNVMLIRIDYRVRDTNTIHNLVYPFFINEGPGL